MRPCSIRLVAALATLAQVSCSSADSIPGPPPPPGPRRSDPILLAGLNISGPVANALIDANRIAVDPSGAGVQVTVSFVGARSDATAFAVVARVAPRIISTRPPREQTGVPLNAVIAIVFTEPVDPTSVNATSVTLKAGASLVPGEVRVGDRHRNRHSDNHGKELLRRTHRHGACRRQPGSRWRDCHRDLQRPGSAMRPVRAGP